MNVKRNLAALLFLLWMSVGLCAAQNQEGLKVHYLGANHSLIQVVSPRKYLLLPVEEAAPEATIHVLVNNKVERTLTVRLAMNRVDYRVPFDLAPYETGKVSLDVHTGNSRANVRDAMEDACWSDICLSDTFDASNSEAFRPLFHHTPRYWLDE